MNPHMLPKIRSRKVLDGMLGMKECQLKLAGFVGMRCSHVSTLVPCHLPTIGKGTATKVSDIFAVPGCDICHSILDGRNMPALTAIQNNYPAAFNKQLMRASHATISYLIGEGFIVVPGADII